MPCCLELEPILVVFLYLIRLPTHAASLLRPFPLFTPTLRWEPNIFAEFHISKLSGLRPYKGTTYVQKGFDETVLPCGLK